MVMNAERGLSAEDLAKLLEGLIERECSTRIIIRLVFEPVSGLHIGSGAKGEQLLEFFRVGGEPYIPLSSVKGALRNLCETIGSSIKCSNYDIRCMMMNYHTETEEGGVEHIIGDQNLIQVIKELLDPKNASGRILRRFIPPEDLEEIREEIIKNRKSKGLEPLLAFMCPICRLFGGPGVGSLTIIKSVTAYGKKELEYTTHVGIDRSTSTAKSGILYTIERFKPERVVVDLVVDCIEPGSLEARLLASMLNYIKLVGLSLGGRKNIGIGSLRMVENINDRSGSDICGSVDTSYAIVKKFEGLLKDEDKWSLIIEFCRGDQMSIEELIRYLSHSHK